MIELTLEKAFELAKSFVDPNPAFIYKDEAGRSGYAAKCHYIHGSNTEDERPGCIVGKIFDAIGVDREMLIRFDRNSRTAGQAIAVLNGHGNKITEDACLFLANLQSAQDNGRTWGESLKEAVKLFDNAS